MKFWVWALVMAPFAAAAADAPLYGPAPTWVAPAKAAESPKTPPDQQVRTILVDVQARLGAEADETYFEFVAKAQTAEGLSAIGGINQVWDPQTDTFTIHRLRLIRDGKTIDLLAEGKRFTVLRREENLEQSSIDGRLTATIQLEDLRVGDTVDFAASLRHHDPSFASRSEAFLRIGGPGVVDHQRQRVIWPSDMPVRWRQSAGMPKASVRTIGKETELLLDLDDVMPAKPAKLAPPRFNDLNQTQVSAYDSWAQVSAVLFPLFERTAVLEPDSPLRAEVARIRQASSDPLVRAGLALQMVEDKVRYVFVAENLGGYRPAAADLTWTRRWGDCKAKTVLLVALLRELGLNADAALVSTGHGDGLEERLPGVATFDHAIVRLRLGAKTYWLDGTRIGDRDVSRLNPPSYRKALPLIASGSDLVTIEQPPFATPMQELNLRIDASAGLSAPAPSHAELVFRDDTALAIDKVLHTATKDELEKLEHGLWANAIGWITPKTFAAQYDAERREAKLSMDGAAELEWSNDDSARGRSLHLVFGDMGGNVDLKREPDTNQDAPYLVTYPSYVLGHLSLTLPDKGLGYSLEGRDLDRTVAGTRYRRTTTLKDGVVEMITVTQALQPEFPANEALNAMVELRALNDEEAGVRAPLDYGETQQEKKNLSALDPKTTEDYFKRAEEMFGKMETAKAVADYDEVLRREPNMGAALVGRGRSYLRQGHRDLALADLDKALSLQPDSLSVLFYRAEALFDAGKHDAALADASTAVRLAPAAAEPLLHRADLRRKAGALADALVDIDAALKIDPGSWAAQETRSRILAALGQRAEADKQISQIGVTADVLNARCYARAIDSLALDQALNECNEAIRLAPASASIIDSRGFVWFRKGEWAKAIEDLNAALRLSPTLPTSLYVRGLAKKRLGQTAAGDADIAAARALSADIDHVFADYGVKP
jgi:tetratricopeptide (TPR) repeat protein